MRRSIVAAVAALGLALSLQTSAEARPAPTSAPDMTDQLADRALETASRLLSGDAAAAADVAGARPDITLLLRDVLMALPRLEGDERRQAEGLLARPTDGDQDPGGDGYTVAARRKCRDHFCVHWVPTTRDAPPGRGWVDTNLAVLNQVWRAEVGKLGYRAPLADGRRGGNGKLDVYLKELGRRGLFGYCAPERRSRNARWLASGYCVIDNDFARKQFGSPPRQSLRVTAAHEFFHAVQFAYDYGEDHWLMESTATWIEERVADKVNDNRQYLRFGQVGQPAQPLDKFNQQGFNQYGNWAFFEYLSDRFGNGVVRTIWNRAGAFPGAGRQYSTAAVKGALRKHRGFVRVYRAFAVANTMPGRSYPEGDRWPTARPARQLRLSAAQRRASAEVRINHMASRSVVVRRTADVRKRHLRITVDGPVGRKDPAAYLVVHQRHGVTQRAIALDDQGRGRASVDLGRSRARSVTVVLVNASTRFSCWRRTTWSCQGRPQDDAERFAVTAAVRRS